jgi:hypothetical protein
MVDLDGTKLETADTAKGNLPLTGSPLLGTLQRSKGSLGTFLQFPEYKKHGSINSNDFPLETRDQ